MGKTEDVESHIQRQNDGALQWLPILMYHHVVPRRHQGLESVEVTFYEFEQQMRFLKEHGYESIHLDEAAHSLTQGKYTVEKPVVITFDDGYLDVFLHAFPILRKYRFTADLFLVSSQLDDPANGVSDSTSRLPLLAMPQLQEMARYGISFGSHSVTHRRLAGLSEEEAWEEIKGSKTALERILGLPVDSFSFPHGCWNRRLQAMVKEAGYVAACGVEQREHTLYNLSRIDASRCRGSDLRWQIHTSGLFFRLRQRNSLRKVKDFLYRFKFKWRRR